MAYSTPRTWVTADDITAARLNQDLRDNILSLHDGAYDAWTAYVPTVKFGATTATIVNASKKTTFGKLQIVNLAFRISNVNAGTGTMTITIPARTTITDPPGFYAMAMGSGSLFDSSAAAVYPFIVTPNTTSDVVFRSCASPSVALTHAAPITIVGGASGTGDEIYATITYELV